MSTPGSTSWLYTQHRSLGRLTKLSKKFLQLIRYRKFSIFSARKKVSPAHGTRGMLILHPLLQTTLVQQVTAIEPAHHRLRLEPVQAHTTVSSSVRWAKPDRLKPVEELISQARFGFYACTDRIRLRGGKARGEDAQEREDQISEERDGESCVRY